MRYKQINNQQIFRVKLKKRESDMLGGLKYKFHVRTLDKKVLRTFHSEIEAITWARNNEKFLSVPDNGIRHYIGHYVLTFAGGWEVPMQILIKATDINEASRLASTLGKDQIYEKTDEVIVEHTDTQLITKGDLYALQRLDLIPELEQ